MKITQPSFRVEERDEKRGGLAIIETAARNCYKSEARTSEGTAERLVASLIARGHEAMLEHGDYIFEISDEHIYRNVCEDLQIIRDHGSSAPMIHTTCISGRPIVSGNIRAWRELFAMSLAGAYFIGHMDPIYTQGFLDSGIEPDPRVRQIFYKDLSCRGERLVHERMTVRWIVDRGISHEIVRHRPVSYAQESTRYANYSKEQFGKEITVIRPSFLAPDSAAYQAWETSCKTAENAYFSILDIEGAPEKARTVLPTSLKTEVIMTANLEEWRHFFAQRALGKTGKPHPQMAEVALPLYELIKVLKPELGLD